MYGYDFMIDDNLNPWLIEINSSPVTVTTEFIVDNLCGQKIN